MTISPFQLGDGTNEVGRSSARSGRYGRRLRSVTSLRLRRCASSFTQRIGARQAGAFGATFPTRWPDAAGQRAHRQAARHQLRALHFTRLDDASFDELERLYVALKDEGRRAIAPTSVTPQAITVKRAADMRYVGYVGQEHAVAVDLPLAVFRSRDRAAIKRHVDATHERRYGTCAPDERAEIVSSRTAVTGVMPKPRPETIAMGGAAPPAAALTGRRPSISAGDSSTRRPTRAPRSSPATASRGPRSWRRTRRRRCSCPTRSRSTRSATSS